MSAPRTGSLLWTLALLVGLAIVSWSLFHWLTVERPDRSRLISDSAVYADQGRSLMREQVYMDRLVTPVQVVLFRSGPPHPAASWAPLYPALVGMWWCSTRRRPSLRLVRHLIFRWVFNWPQRVLTVDLRWRFWTSSSPSVRA